MESQNLNLNRTFRGVEPLGGVGGVAGLGCAAAAGLGCAAAGGGPESSSAKVVLRRLIKALTLVGSMCFAIELDIA